MKYRISAHGFDFDVEPHGSGKHPEDAAKAVELLQVRLSGFQPQEVEELHAIHAHGGGGGGGEYRNLLDDAAEDVVWAVTLDWPAEDAEDADETLWLDIRSAGPALERLPEVRVEVSPAWPTDAPGTLRLSAWVDDRPAFLQMDVPPDAHGEYATWARWNGLEQPPGFQHIVQRLVDAS